MRAVRRVGVCTAVSLVVAGLSLPGAVAQGSPPTTPIPAPVDPSQPPASVPIPTPGPVVAGAGTMVGIVRVLPGTVPADSIYEDPEFEDQLPKQSVAEAGLGRAVAQANSTAFFAHERAIAEASPAGVALFGKLPQLPVGVAQAALPDRPEPVSTRIQPPSSPADQLVRLSGLEGTAHARWDRYAGPCVSPIADARYSLGSASAGTALPGRPLDGGPLLQVPGTAQAHSSVRLVDVPGQATEAVRSTSDLSLAGVRLFAGTPHEVAVDVVGTPRLTATATGDPATSTVEHEAPVLRVSRGGQEIGVLDPAHPRLDVPLPPLDAGVLRLALGELEQHVAGTEVRAQARLFDLQVLRGHAVGLPTSLVQASFGEQAVQASAPEGGVDCTTAPAPAALAAAPPTTPLPPSSSGVAPALWTSAALLLLGGTLAVLSRRQPV